MLALRRNYGSVFESSNDEVASYFMMCAAHCVCISLDISVYILGTIPPGIVMMIPGGIVTVAGGAWNRIERFFGRFTSQERIDF